MGVPGEDRVMIGTPLSAFLVFQSTSTNQMVIFILSLWLLQLFWTPVLSIILEYLYIIFYRMGVEF